MPTKERECPSPANWGWRERAIEKGGQPWRRAPRSKALYEQAQTLIPGGVEHNLASNFPFPLTMDRAEGCRLWDVDGNVYVDYLMCGVSIILGHNYPPRRDAVIDLIREKGPCTGVGSEY